MNNAELERLKADALDAKKSVFYEGWDANTIIALIERIEALTVDAERYKHVRKHSEMYYFAYRNPDMGHAFSQVEGKVMDQIVDVVMALEKK